MSNINYEVEVKKVEPDACSVSFANTALKCHIRLYGDKQGRPCSIGKGDTYEEAWQSAYENLPKTI